MKKELSWQETQERNRFFQLALQEEQKNQLKVALDLYRMSLKIDSNFFDSWLNAGAIYSRSGKTEKAVSCFQRAIISRPDKRAYYNLASEYFKQGRFYHALDTVERAISLDDRFLQAHLLMGYCYGKLHENEKSEQAILKALKLEPNHFQTLYALALLYFHQNKLQESLRYVEILLEQDAQNIAVQKLKASLTLKEGNVKESILVFREIAESDPQLQKIYEGLDKNWSSEAKTRAMRTKEELLNKREKTKQDYLDLSLLLLFSGEPKKAMEYLMMAAPDSKIKL